MSINTTPRNQNENIEKITADVENKIQRIEESMKKNLLKLEFINDKTIVIL